MMQEGQSRQKHPKCVLSVQVFNRFASLYFWWKPYPWGKDRWEARRGLKSALAARVRWRRDWDTHLWQRTWSQMLLFLWHCSRWWAGYSPQLWLLKQTKKGTGKPFPVKLTVVFPVKAFHPELLFSDSWDGRGEGEGVNSWPVLFLNYKALGWCFIFR